jgi:hypothetical protein
MVRIEMNGVTRLNLKWLPYTIPYRLGTYIAFPSHIKDVIRATDKEIGGVILFSKPEIHANKKILLANSIFLSAGEAARVQWSRILTTIKHGSYMIFHTHPKDNPGYQGYSSDDLYLLLFYGLKSYKYNVPIHYCLSTGKDIHFTFIDPVVITIIRTLMKLLKPMVIARFPGTTDSSFQIQFMLFFKMLLDSFQMYCVIAYAAIPHSDTRALSELDTISFTPYSGYDKLKRAVNSFLVLEEGRIYTDNPIIMFIYENYEIVASRIYVTIEGSTQEQIPHILTYMGLFKTSSLKKEAFFRDDHAGIQCLDSGKIYDETVPWVQEGVIENLEPLSPYHGGSLGKVVYFNNSYKHIRKSKLKTRKTHRRKTSSKNRNGTAFHPEV